MQSPSLRRSLGKTPLKAAGRTPLAMAPPSPRTTTGGDAQKTPRRTPVHQPKTPLAASLAPAYVQSPIPSAIPLRLYGDQGPQTPAQPRGTPTKPLVHRYAPDTGTAPAARKWNVQTPARMRADKENSDTPNVRTHDDTMDGMSPSPQPKRQRKARPGIKKK